MKRYSRQMLYRNIGEEGQNKLLSAKVAVAGLGALGSVAADELARAGVGYLRLIDRDRVEEVNLHRQTLYTEKDAREKWPKSAAAYSRLSAVNSGITIEAVCAEINPETIDDLLGGVDLIIDATDNLETRYLINEYCVENQLPWTYGGAAASEGMTGVFLPGGPCFSCFTGKTTADSEDQPKYIASTVGVLNTLTAVIASLEVNEAIKLIADPKSVRKDIIFMELWENELVRIPLEKNTDCPVCQRHEYSYLKKTC